MTVNLTMEVTTDSGGWSVNADLRDQARWEQYAAKNGYPTRITQEDSAAPATLYLMHLAWTASRRAGQYAGQFPQWLDECSAVDSQEQPETDPTRPEPGIG